MFARCFTVCLLAAPFLIGKPAPLFMAPSPIVAAPLFTAQVTAKIWGNLTRTVQTNSEGQFRLEFLPIGNYSMEVAAAGFKKFVQKGVTLEVNVTARVDAVLDLGRSLKKCR